VRFLAKARRYSTGLLTNELPEWRKAVGMTASSLGAHGVIAKQSLTTLLAVGLVGASATSPIAFFVIHLIKSGKESAAFCIASTPTCV
jgi:hypothetical protein